MVAGASPLLAPLSQYSWQAFSAPWQVDVKAAFHWLQASLQRPLQPGGRFVLFSSGAALHGSPLSGGYAGAKQTQRFMARYAAKEAAARELDLCFQTLLPQLNPNTDLGRAGIAAYAALAGRRAMQDAFDELCGLINKDGVCHQCAGLRGLVDPQRQSELPAIPKPREEGYRVRLRIVQDTPSEGVLGELHRLMAQAIEATERQA